MDKKNIVVIGCSGAIGSSFVNICLEHYPNASIHAFSRKSPDNILSNVSYYSLDYLNEEEIEKSAVLASKEALIDHVFVATGLLHSDNILPEKSLKMLTAKNLNRLFEVNTVVPALVAKYFLPKLNRNHFSTFSALSARVGSITDNYLGGWYAYRASKAALNMILKNASIEIKRSNKNAIIVGLHPGTVDSNLSKPFQANVPDGQLFSSDFAARKLFKVLLSLTPEQSGKLFSWSGDEILP